MFVNTKIDWMRPAALALALVLMTGCALPAASGSAEAPGDSASETVWGVSESLTPVVSELPVTQFPAPDSISPSAVEALPTEASAAEPEIPSE